MSDLAVMRTHKLLIGGAFVRSESGRTFVLKTAKGDFIANVALASRKDARDAVLAARSAFEKWSGTTAYNRGQVLYRVAEIMQGRKDQFVEELMLMGSSKRDAVKEVEQAIDRWVWYAGWSDKLAMVNGSANPVAGNYFNFSLPEPTGIVAIIPEDAPSLYALVDSIAAVIVSGNSSIVIANKKSSLVAVSLAESLATSDVPAGVVNILTGDAAEIAPWLASHSDVNAIDLSGISKKELAMELEKAAAENLKRVLRPDKNLPQGLNRINLWLETKTVWHPRGY
jgi:acyl-CoA reductase-like NAD-dependent aldehyde dehydrogenase